MSAIKYQKELDESMSMLMDNYRKFDTNKIDSKKGLTIVSFAKAVTNKYTSAYRAKAQSESTTKSTRKPKRK